MNQQMNVFTRQELNNFFLQGVQLLRWCILNLLVTGWASNIGIALMFTLQSSDYKVISSGVLLKVVHSLFQKLNPLVLLCDDYFQLTFLLHEAREGFLLLHYCADFLELREFFISVISFVNFLIAVS